MPQPPLGKIASTAPTSLLRFTAKKWNSYRVLWYRQEGSFAVFSAQFVLDSLVGSYLGSHLAGPERYLPIDPLSGIQAVTLRGAILGIMSSDHLGRGPSAMLFLLWEMVQPSQATYKLVYQASSDAIQSTSTKTWWIVSQVVKNRSSWSELYQLQSNDYISTTVHCGLYP